MIKKLTPEQEAKFPYYVKKWTDIGLSTEPANREKAEDGIRKCYLIAGLEIPKKIIWCDSPLSMCLTKHVLANVKDIKVDIGSSVRHSVWDSVWDSVRHSIGASVRDSVWASVWHSVRHSIGISVWDSVGDSVRHSVRDSVWDSVRHSVGDSLGGQHYAGTSSFFDFFRSELNFIEQTDKWIGNQIITENAGWWLPYSDICFISERHNILNRDESGRLHSMSGPAVQYPDGWSIYSIHGVRVKEHIVNNPELITIEEIESEKNAEVRRVMIELFGNDRYLKESGASLISKDKYGELYQKQVEGDDEKFTMVKVINSTPEPDGTFKIYFLQVPPGCQTAHEAVASTFGKTVKEYNPEIET